MLSVWSSGTVLPFSVAKCTVDFKALNTLINPELLGNVQAFAESTTINNKMGPSYKKI